MAARRLKALLFHHSAGDPHQNFALRCRERQRRLGQPLRQRRVQLRTGRKVWKDEGAVDPEHAALDGGDKVRGGRSRGNQHEAIAGL
jgi:hypothetical protein